MSRRVRDATAVAQSLLAQKQKQRDPIKDTDRIAYEQITPISVVKKIKNFENGTVTELQDELYERFSGGVIYEYSCFAVRCDNIAEKKLAAFAETLFDCGGDVWGFDGKVQTIAGTLRPTWLREALAFASEHEQLVDIQLVSHATCAVVDWIDVYVHPDGTVQKFNMGAAAEDAAMPNMTEYEGVIAASPPPTKRARKGNAASKSSK